MAPAQLLTADAAAALIEDGQTVAISGDGAGMISAEAIQPPDLTDDQWDYGSSDGDIFAVIKRGLPPTMMPGFDGQISDDDMWRIVNYLRTLSSKR